MKNAAGMQLNNNEDVGRSEEEIMDDGEITSPDLGGMIPDKSCPGLVRFPSFLGHIPLDGAFTDFDAQLEQLPPDSFGTPRVIFLGHPLDEGDRLGADMRFMLRGFRFASPVDPEKLAMPTEHGVGLHDM